MMNIIELGEGPSVLILHGSPSPISDLLPLAQRLAVDHHVLIPELPGYGQSPPDADASFDRIGDVLAEILVEHASVRPRAIIGFSSGAYRALDLALQRNVSPDLIVALGALASLEETDRALFRAVAAGLRADPSGAEIRPILPGRWLSETWRKAHPADDARVTAWFDLTSPQQLAAELSAEAEMRDLRPLLPGLACALYLRVGELDLACPPSLSLEMANLAPHATVDVIPGCGHALMIENGPETIARVVEIVTRQRPTR